MLKGFSVKFCQDCLQIEFKRTLRIIDKYVLFGVAARAIFPGVHFLNLLSCSVVGVIESDGVVLVCRTDIGCIFVLVASETRTLFESSGGNAGLHQS